MKTALIAAGALAALALSGCGSDDSGPTPGDFDHGDTVVGATSGESPNFTAAAYPAAPYGTQLDSVIANVEFLGWSRPVEAGFDTNNFEKVRLSDFYDPDGSKGIKVIMINSSAGWCSVCRAEYKGSYGMCAGTFSTCTSDNNCSGGKTCEKKSLNDHYLELKDQGVVFLGTLFEDSSNPPKPAKPLDLQSWADSYNVEFPMALDPGFKLGSFFTADATPMNLVVDAKTMRITGKVLGGDIGKMFQLIDETLKQ